MGIKILLGPLAQSVEQRTFNPWVVGSIPTGPTDLHIDSDILRTNLGANFNLRWMHENSKEAILI